MASKSGQPEPEKAEVIEELLDDLDTALDRVKVLYEQYFLGIQKQPPTHPHTDVERRIRDLAQRQIRNTALRYRFATLQQKFGAYNSYWRRTLRQIENGTYTRSLSKIGRQAVRTGAAVPEEILAAMPRRMREQVVRDREAALALAELRERQRHDRKPLALAGEHIDALGAGDLDPAAFVRESTAGGAHRVDESDAELDVDSTEPALPRRSTGPMRAVTARAKTDPGTSAEPAPPRRTTDPMRAATPPPIPPRARAATGGDRPARSFPRAPSPVPSRPEPPRPATPAPSQATRPLHVVPGAAAAHAPTSVETLVGPFARTPHPSSPEVARSVDRSPTPSQSSAGEIREGLPPGMSNADVNTLYAQYVRAKRLLGQETEPGTYGKLLRTIAAQAPKIMEQYKSRGVDFSVVVKDNQVIIRAKPKL